MKFTITRSKWLRGEGGQASALLRSGDEKMCCMGQVAEQCGINRNALYELKILSDLDESEAYLLPQNIRRTIATPQWVTQAYKANDDKNASEFEREKRLQELAAANGHEFVFVD